MTRVEYRDLKFDQNRTKIFEFLECFIFVSNYLPWNLYQIYFLVGESLVMALFQYKHNDMMLELLGS